MSTSDPGTIPPHWWKDLMIKCVRRLCHGCSEQHIKPSMLFFMVVLLLVDVMDVRVLIYAVSNIWQLSQTGWLCILEVGQHMYSLVVATCLLLCQINVQFIPLPWPSYLCLEQDTDLIFVLSGVIRFTALNCWVIVWQTSYMLQWRSSSGGILQFNRCCVSLALEDIFIHHNVYFSLGRYGRGTPNILVLMAIFKWRKYQGPK